jgi:hypothetical protein
MLGLDLAACTWCLFHQALKSQEDDHLSRNLDPRPHLLAIDPDRFLTVVPEITLKLRLELMNLAGCPERQNQALNLEEDGHLSRTLDAEAPAVETREHPLRPQLLLLLNHQIILQVFQQGPDPRVLVQSGVPKGYGPLHVGE